MRNRHAAKTYGSVVTVTRREITSPSTIRHNICMLSTCLAFVSLIKARLD